MSQVLCVLVQVTSGMLQVPKVPFATNSSPQLWCYTFCCEYLPRSYVTESKLRISKLKLTGHRQLWSNLLSPSRKLTEQPKIKLSLGSCISLCIESQFNMYGRSNCSCYCGSCHNIKFYLFAVDICRCLWRETLAVESRHCSVILKSSILLLRCRSTVMG